MKYELSFAVEKKTLARVKPFTQFKLNYKVQFS